SSDLWFNESRFGMFIHWGAYSSAARGEWVMNRERIPKDEYIKRYVETFKAENYDPAAWAALAKKAGMKYGVLTTRHHDGFALWPTDTDDFHAGNYGPKRDLVGPYVEAFRAAGLKVGLYFSPGSWTHPDYPGPFYRDWPAKTDWSSDAARERFIEYYRAQVIELMTRYGKIDYLWYDGAIPTNMCSSEVNEEVLRLQPDILINERNGEPFHVLNCEQAIKAPKEERLWEACMTLNNNWGYHAGDDNWKQPTEVIELLAETSAGAGNLLLNVGPMADGTIPEESIKILETAGNWLKHNGGAIYNSSRNPYSWTNWGKITTCGNCVYLIVHRPTGDELCYSEISNKVLSAKILSTGKPVEFEQTNDRLLLRGLPKQVEDGIGFVIALELDGEPMAITPKTSFWIPG
ncbi:MAG: alpha-L-fucosidase, partial [Puniceicoccales bacterium]